MSLLFTAGGSQSVVIANAAALNGYAAQTYAAWIFPVSLAPAAEDCIFAKSGANQGLYLTTAGQLRMAVLYASANAGATAAGTLVANTWNFVAGTQSGTAAPKLYFGNLTTPAAEAASYAAQTAPVGARADNTGTLIIGNRSTALMGFPGRIALFSYWNVALTLAQLKAHQQAFAGLNADGCKVNMAIGVNGADATDRSGNGFTGTITGATQAPHVPLTLSRVGGGALMSGSIHRGQP